MPNKHNNNKIRLELSAAEKQNRDMFCKLLKHYRKRKNLSQRDLGLKLGLSRSGYANYENGTCLPCVDQINRLSDILDYDFLFAFTKASTAIAYNDRKKDPAMLVCDSAGNYHYDSRISPENSDILFPEHTDPDLDQLEFLKLYTDMNIHDRQIVLEYMKLKRSTYYEQHLHIYEEPESAE